MNIAIVTSGYLPVPASLGGAVECLVDQIIRENEKQNKCRLTIFSADEPKAREMARTLEQTEVRFIRTPLYCRAADWLIYQIIRRIRPGSQLMSWRFICRRLHFIRRTAAVLQQENFDHVVLENHATLLRVMKKRGNAKSMPVGTHTTSTMSRTDGTAVVRCCFMPIA